MTVSRPLETRIIGSGSHVSAIMDDRSPCSFCDGISVIQMRFSLSMLRGSAVRSARGMPTPSTPPATYFKYPPVLSTYNGSFSPSTYSTHITSASPPPHQSISPAGCLCEDEAVQSIGPPPILVLSGLRVDHWQRRGSYFLSCTSDTDPPICWFILLAASTNHR